MVDSRQSAEAGLRELSSHTASATGAALMWQRDCRELPGRFKHRPLGVRTPLMISVDLTCGPRDLGAKAELPECPRRV